MWRAFISARSPHLGRQKLTSRSSERFLGSRMGPVWQEAQRRSTTSDALRLTTQLRSSFTTCMFSRYPPMEPFPKAA